MFLPMSLEAYSVGLWYWFVIDRMIELALLPRVTRNQRSAGMFSTELPMEE